MNSSAPATPSATRTPPAGLPNINYYPPVVATLLAAALLCLAGAALGLIGALNTLSQIMRATSGEEGGSLLGAGFCGPASLVALAGAVYFFIAVIKGIRDLREKVYYTRGTVVEGRPGGTRSAKNWLLIEPAYSGTDLSTASAFNDEQNAASVDRSQILQPRFASDSIGGTARQSEIDPLAPRGGSYLSPERVSASARKPAPDGGEAEKAIPKVVFRVDFAARANLAPGEEVLVAHSRHLQHPFYAARLRDGQWEVYRNRALI